MCDTIVATSEVTKDGVTIFGKNSDREPNEAHHLLSVPSANHPPESNVKCTYIDIPQVAHTYSVLLAKPFWMWGAEMGVNEHGVAIGNEAVFSKIPAGRKEALTGMDLLRLALERAATAREAVKMITDLLDDYGQGGNCGFKQTIFYHNSFIIADPLEAWLLETIERHWAARQIKGVHTISNGLTIGTQWDIGSPDLVNYAVQKGWCKGRDDFHFARCYSDVMYTKLSDCRRRGQRTKDLLLHMQGEINIGSAISVLRDHGEFSGADWRPDKGVIGSTVCMHAGFGPVRGSQTTGSMVSYLDPTHPTHFFTGTAAPCTSIFKPVWLDTRLPDTGPEPTGTYHASSLFWQHELLHRETLKDYPTRIKLYREDRDILEQKFINQAVQCASRSIENRSTFSDQCFSKARDAQAQWLEKISDVSKRTHRKALYTTAWNKFDSQAGMPFSKFVRARPERF